MNDFHRQPTDLELEWHHSRCRRGWLTPPDADKPIPCVVCRPHLRTTETDRRPDRWERQ